ncbi:hypothetical protein [Pyrinomonas methylaliphatogenes]|jgi:hypothetical protein|uniref:Uncharacterized protein n=1 Tax=Pyrinomonas methylaliphatogenes TaxID=454194 RepID=A0A0B6X1K7_9BACT|nr:hypothetical protein [Pyrinomonas methylaliphatogenes]MBX5478179.1 hypothetical protein [Pyrinomonas methylaliphatogenes]CDM66444.1 hypothetical protein PYK22_02474 [Pyrinomonas methylaliphatogenes]
MKAVDSTPLSTITVAEREVHAAAERLRTQIEESLAAVANHSQADVEDLEVYADRLERLARDLAVALRELARERRKEDQS